MINSLRLKISTLFFLFIVSGAFAQNWVKMMNDPITNFYQIQEEFNKHWEGRAIEKGKGWKQFRRYEYFAEPRVYPSGDRALASRAKAFEEFQKYSQENPIQYSRFTAQWTPLGPFGAPNGGGAGRVNCIRIHPNDNDILFAGTPAGGLWKTKNGGISWDCLTDNLPVIGTSDIAIDHENPEVIYLATGDGDGGDTQSIGVLKSTDGGKTWNPTGLNWQVTQQRRISRLLMHPDNNQILLAGANNGIFRTEDGGQNWTQVSSTTGIKDMEFKPGDPNVVYAGSNRLIRSSDNGMTWANVTSGIPSTTQLSRIAIAVTEHDPSYVYVLAGGNDNGFYGLYRSTNSGTSFSAMSNSPNLLGWNPNGGDSGGQAWYDLAIAASPLNKNEIYVGGVNLWKSTNGGSSWSLNAHWYGGGGVPYVHADHHDLVFVPGTNILYNGNDGGVFKTINGGSIWNDLSANMQIAQIYRLGISASNDKLLLTGHQDNGSNRMNGTTWDEVNGGDGMECFVDRTNNNIMFTSLYYGAFYKSTNGGNSFSGINSGLPDNGAWVTPWVQDPSNANTLYSGFSQIYKTTNQGNNWSQVGNITGSGTFRSLAVAPSNNQVIYAARTNSIFKTTDGGSTWVNITQGLPASSNAITYIAVDPLNENNIWVTFSGYSANNKVFNSLNGGTNWTNISSGLPNLPVNCVVAQKGVDNAIYVGTDVGVYYKEGAENWVPYFVGLPNVIVNELEIYYPTNKIRAATYGRGVWECDLFNAQTPAANFNADKKEICLGGTVNFSDLSVGTPTVWKWSFPGGTPSTSNLQNPTVVYQVEGTFDVSLVITNNVGNHIAEKKAYIKVKQGESLPLTEDFEADSFPSPGWIIFNGGQDVVSWKKTSAAGGFSTSNSSMFIDNFSNNVIGAVDEFISPVINLTDFTSASLSFDVAYALRNATISDSLAVAISTDCGENWSHVYFKSGTDLATSSNQATVFVPTSSQWRNETIDLTNYIGNTILLKFKNISGNGNNIYIDNININGSGGSGLLAKFSSTPGNLCDNGAMQFSDDSDGNPISWEWTFTGGAPALSALQNPSVTYSAPGTYPVMLKVSNGTVSKAFFREVTIWASTDTTLHINECTNSFTLNDQTYTTSGIYTQTRINSVGCDSTITINLNFAEPTSSSLEITRCSSYNLNGQFYNSSGTYTQILTNKAGCDSTITLNLTIRQTSTNTLIETGCNSATINGVTYAASGSFTQLLTNSVGCDSVLTINLNITYLDTTVTQSENSLTAKINGASYQWLDCDNGNSIISGATSQSFIPDADGRYAVKIISGTCTVISSCHNFVTVGLAENYFAKSIAIFPNPTKGNLIVRFSHENTAALVEINDITGRIVLLKNNVNTRQLEIDLNNEAPGMYFVKIISGDNKAVFKVIKEN
jgi:photosystem II stability/assembly factor-like uncharacterized protein